VSLEYWILIITAFLTSTLSGVLGMGGGMALFTVMAQYFPPIVLIPVHGFVQLFSNFFRATFIVKAIRWPIVGLFLLGAATGALLGAQFIVAIPEKPFRIGIGLFILLVTFIPKPKSAPVFPAKWFWVGSGATFLSLFVGPTGPLVAPFYLREHLPKKALVATKAACQVGTHICKLAGYFAAGFVVQPHIPLLLGMCSATLAGSFLGTKILGKLPETLFKRLFKLLILLLALRLVYKGVAG